MIVTLPDQVGLDTEEYGRRDAPLALVLLHGWTLDKRIWRGQAAALADTDVRVLTYDARGHGRSGAIPRERATVAQLADDLADFLDAALEPGQRAVLGGHSLGGMTVLEYAYRHPERFTERVGGAVFIATTAEGSAHTRYGFTSAWLARAFRRAEIGGAYLLARAGVWRPHRYFAPALRPVLRWLLFGQPAVADALRLTTSTLAASSLQTIGGFRSSVEEYRRPEALSAFVDVPAAVLVGSRDRLTPPECAEAIADALPHARLVVCPDAGHMLMLERPDDVTDAIRSVLGAAGVNGAR